MAGKNSRDLWRGEFGFPLSFTTSHTFRMQARPARGPARTAPLQYLVAHVVGDGPEEQVSTSRLGYTVQHVDPEIVGANAGAIVADVQDVQPIGHRLATRQFPREALRGVADAAGAWLRESHAAMGWEPTA